MSAEHVMQAAGLVFACGTVWIGLATFLRYRHPRVVACPAGDQPAAIQIDARHAAFTAVPHPLLRVASCSRWPEGHNCGQLCLDGVEADKRRSPIRRFARWYAGRRCARCAAPLLDLRWVDRPPALMDREGHIVAWYEIPSERLQARSQALVPICWGCHAFIDLHLEDSRLETSAPDGVRPEIS